MAEPTLTEVFGAGALEDALAIVVTKAAMAERGLTPAAQNTAESMFVAMLLNARLQLTPDGRAADIANRNVTIEFSGQDLVDQGAGNVFLRDTFQVSLYRPTTIAAIDPDNY